MSEDAKFNLPREATPSKTWAWSDGRKPPLTREGTVMIGGHVATVVIFEPPVMVAAEELEGASIHLNEELARVAGDLMSNSVELPGDLMCELQDHLWDMLGEEE